MKIEEIKTIVKLMSENDLTEFKIEAEDMHLCIRRGSQQTAAMAPQAVMAAPAVVPATPAAPAPAAGSGPRLRQHPLPRRRLSMQARSLNPPSSEHFTGPRLRVPMPL